MQIITAIVGIVFVIISISIALNKYTPSKKNMVMTYGLIGIVFLMYGLNLFK